MRLLTRLFVVTILVAVAGCGATTQPTATHFTCPGNCGTSTAPLKVFSSAFALRSSSDYATLLDDRFVFVTLPADVTGRVDSLGRAVELSFSKHLFTDGATGQAALAKVLLQIDTTSSGPDNRVGHDGWMRIVAQTNFVGTFQDGQEIHITAPAWLYFRQVSAGVWKLAEWRDQPNSGTSPGRGAAPNGTGSARTTSWTSLHYLYL